MKNFVKALAAVAGMLAAYIALQLAILMAAGAAFALSKGVGQQLASGAVDNIPLLIDQGAAFITAHSGELVGLSNLLTLGVFALYYRSREEGPLPCLIRCRPLAARFLGPVALLALSMAFVVSFGLPLLPFEESTASSYAQSSQLLLGGGVLAFFSTVLVAPVFEEVLFRGMIYNRLKAAMPPLAAGLISCAIFGALHGNAIWILYAFFVGAMMTLVYEKYGSIYANIVFHMVFNLVGGYVTTGIYLEGFGYGLLLTLSGAAFAYLLIKLIKRPMAGE